MGVIKIPGDFVKFYGNSKSCKIRLKNSVFFTDKIIKPFHLINVLTSTRPQCYIINCKNKQNLFTFNIVLIYEYMLLKSCLKCILKNFVLLL